MKQSLAAQKPLSVARGLYVGICCLTLFLPAPFVIPDYVRADADDTAVELYGLYPASGPIVFLSLEDWSLDGFTCAIFVTLILGCTALLSYSWHRWTSRFTPDIRFGTRLALPVCLFFVSLAQGAFAFFMIHAMYGVMHS